MERKSKKGNTGKVISQEGELKKKVPKRSWFIINEISTHTISYGVIMPLELMAVSSVADPAIQQKMLESGTTIIIQAEKWMIS